MVPLYRSIVRGIPLQRAEDATRASTPLRHKDIREYNIFFFLDYSATINKQQCGEDITICQIWHSFANNDQ